MFGIILSFTILIVAEGLNIWAEMMSAKLSGVRSLFELKNLFLFAIVLIGCSLLLVGYTIGYQSSKNIWTVTVSSIVAILLVEPFIAYAYFHQLPEKGALVGMALSIVAFLVTIFWK